MLLGWSYWSCWRMWLVLEAGGRGSALHHWDEAQLSPGGIIIIYYVKCNGLYSGFT